MSLQKDQELVICSVPKAGLLVDIMCQDVRMCLFLIQIKSEMKKRNDCVCLLELITDSLSSPVDLFLML